MTNELRQFRSTLHGILASGPWPQRLTRLLLSLALLLTSAGTGQPAPVSAAPGAPVQFPPSAPGITLLNSDHGSMTLAFDFSLEQLRVEQSTYGENADQSCQEVTLAGAVKAGDPGQPELPLVSKLVGILPAVTVRVESMALDSVILPGVHAICPALDKGVEVDEAGGVTYVETQVQPDPAVYAQAQPYPAQMVAFADLGYMRSQRLGRVQVSPVQIDPVAGQLTLHRRILVTLFFDQGGINLLSSRSGAGQTVMESAPFETTLAETLLNYEQSRSWRLGPGDLDRLVASSLDQVNAPAAIWTPPSPAYRVKVNSTGIYQLTRAELAAAGLSVDTLKPVTLRLFNAGKEIPITVTGEGDSRFDEGDLVIFYAEGVDTRYTDTNVYWLTYGGANGLRMQQAATVGNGVPVGSYVETVTYERNLNYVSSLPKEEGFDHWYDGQMNAFTGVPGVRTYGLSASNVAQGPITATLAVAVAGHTFGIHHMIVKVNGQAVGDFQWNHRTYLEAQAQVPQSILTANNAIRLEISTDLGGQQIDTVYVDWLSLSYHRQLVAQSGRLDFGDAQAGSWSYAVSGFGGPDVTIYDVTSPGQVAVVPAEVVGGVASFSRTDGAVRRYVAVESARRLSPLAVEAANSISLSAGNVGAGADYILLTHPDFLAAVQPLAEHRAGKGLRVRTVNVQDVYDQFNHGLPSAESIRDFLGYAYANWPGTPPAYVLLVGDGAYDLRGYLETSAPTYMPPFLAMVDPDLGETAAENRFVMLTGDDLLADMYIGRFPVNSPAEATVMVQKTIQYETASPGGPWQKKALFVTDDLANGGGAFYAFSNSVADGTVDGTETGALLIPEEYERQKVYMGFTCDVENPSVICRGEISQAIDDGVAIVSYVGHGTKQEWAAEKLYDGALVQNMSNGAKLPVILAMTCQEGYFQLPDSSALAEMAVRRQNGGAVASWSPTGFGLATGHDLLERGFMLAVFHEEMPVMGPATQRGKLFLYENAPSGRYDDLMDTFMLFGDPALQIVGMDSGSTVFLPLLVR